MGNCCDDYEEHCPVPRDNTTIPFTCAAFGCTGGLTRPKSPCQCYRGCREDKNCCDDYDEVCRAPRDALPPAEQPAPQQPNGGGQLAPMQEAAVQGARCSGVGEDCSESHCCSEPGERCYRKNEYWASCRSSCQDGDVDDVDDTPWSCEPLGDQTPGGAPLGKQAPAPPATAPPTLVLATPSPSMLVAPTRAPPIRQKLKLNMSCGSDEGDCDEGLYCGPSSPPGGAVQTCKQVACDDAADWPQTDGDVSCGLCKHLVRFGNYKSCQEYCSSFGHLCFWAAEQGLGGECEVGQEVACSDDIAAVAVDTTAMHCGCHLLASTTSTTASSVTSSTATATSTATTSTATVSTTRTSTATETVPSSTSATATATSMASNTTEISTSATSTPTSTAMASGETSTQSSAKSRSTTSTTATSAQRGTTEPSSISSAKTTDADDVENETATTATSATTATATTTATAVGEAKEVEKAATDVGAVTCASFSEWPLKDGEVSCGPCKLLVEFGPFRSCHEYCTSFEHECFWAAEDQNGEGDSDTGECNVKAEVNCTDDIAAMQVNSADMLCGCRKSSEGDEPEEAEETEDALPAITKDTPISGANKRDKAEEVEESGEDVTCADFSAWPQKDGEVSCGRCTHLVEFGPFRSCLEFCSSFGHECFWAAEDENGQGDKDNGKCNIKAEVNCSDDIASMQVNSADMLCGCRRHSQADEDAEVEETDEDVTCAAFSEWPQRDGEVSCGLCTHLVEFGPHRSCDEFCSSFGHECFWAAEDQNGEGDSDSGECNIKAEVECSDDIASMQVNSADMLCGCRRPSASNKANMSPSESTSASPTPSPASSSPTPSSVEANASSSESTSASPTPSPASSSPTPSSVEATDEDSGDEDATPSPTGAGVGDPEEPGCEDVSGDYVDQGTNLPITLSQSSCDIIVDMGPFKHSGTVEGKDVKVKTYDSVGTKLANGDIKFSDGGYWVRNSDDEAKGGDSPTPAPTTPAPPTQPPSSEEAEGGESPTPAPATPAPPTQPPSSEEECVDSDGDAILDEGNVECSFFQEHPSMCGHDDTDFSSRVMCCGCGGGVRAGGEHVEAEGDDADSESDQGNQAGGEHVEAEGDDADSESDQGGQSPTPGASEAFLTQPTPAPPQEAQSTEASGDDAEEGGGSSETDQGDQGGEGDGSGDGGDGVDDSEIAVR